MLLRFMPIILSTLLFAAHIMRFYGLIPALAVLLLLFTLFFRRIWIMRFWQISLSLATMVWISAAIDFVRFRLVTDMPWSRLLIIMLAVILLNVFSILWLQHKKFHLYFSASQNPC